MSQFEMCFILRRERQNLKTADEGDYAMNDRFKNIIDEVAHDSINSARDRATWDGANAVERATFGRVFSAIEGVLALIALFGCFLISGATQNSKFFMYLCGILRLIPFFLIGGLLARFQHRVFVRVRQLLSQILGGGRF